MRVRARVLLIGGLVGGLCAACSGSAYAEPTPITDPKLGWVTITHPRTHIRPGDRANTIVQKTCDDTTLVYYGFSLQAGSGGISVIPNSPECAD